MPADLETGGSFSYFQVLQEGSYLEEGPGKWVDNWRRRKKGLAGKLLLASRQTFKSVKYLASFAVLGKGERLQEEEGKEGEIGGSLIGGKLS